MLILGTHLGSKLRQDVLNAFIYRWTSDNPRRESVYANISKPTMPLITDDEWLSKYYFHVTKRGTLDARRRHCEPVL